MLFITSPTKKLLLLVFLAREIQGYHKNFDRPVDPSVLEDCAAEFQKGMLCIAAKKKHKKMFKMF